MASVCSSRHQEIVLRTGYVWVLAGEKKVFCRILLDPGSQRPFVSQGLVQSLVLRAGSSQLVEIQGLAGRRALSEQVDVVNLIVRSRFSRHQIVIHCLKIPRILDGVLLRASYQGKLEPSADSFSEGFPKGVDLLVGADAVHLVYDGPHVREGSIIAAPTVLGWSLWGRNNSSQIFSSVVTSRIFQGSKDD